MKRKTLLIGTLCLLSFTAVVAQKPQQFEPSGKAMGKVFFNYLYDMTDEESQESSFEIKRAYFGYAYHFSEEFTASITLDMGENLGGSDYTVFLKKAQLDWEMSPVVKASFGMIGLEQFNEQEKFWGYRYVFKSYADQYGFGASADLGVKIKFNLSDILYAKAFVINGEGYKKVQDSDGKQKFGADLVYDNKNLIAKLYVDANPSKIGDSGNGENVTTSAFAAFLGYRLSEKFRLGTEFNQMMNGEKYSAPAKDHDMGGWSFYSTYAFSKKFEVFGRYDYLTSNTLQGEAREWNISENGDAIVAGMQYAPVEGVKMALNYQGFLHKDSSREDKSRLYLNFEFKF